MSDKNVTIQVSGGRSIQASVSEIRTVRDARVKAGIAGQNHTAMINGSPAKDTDSVCNFSFITFSPAIKGGSL